jgi:hypothetical protein
MVSAPITASVAEATDAGQGDDFVVFDPFAPSENRELIPPTLVRAAAMPGVQLSD